MTPPNHRKAARWATEKCDNCPACEVRLIAGSMLPWCEPHECQTSKNRVCDDFGKLSGRS